MIVLLKPNDKNIQFQYLSKYSAIEPPYILMLLANLYNDCVIVDAEADMLSFAETLKTVLSFNPTKVVMLPFGNNPSAHINQVDMCNRIKNKIDCSIVHENIFFDPSGLTPRFDLLNPTKYRSHNWHSWTNGCKTDYGVVASSFGCPMSCKFCSVKKWYKCGYIVKSPDNVIKEFEYYAKNNISNIKMLDELFITNRNNVEEICNGIINIGFKFNIWCYGRLDTIRKEQLALLKKAGINWIGIGIESGSEEIRKSSGKGNMSNNGICNTISSIKDNGICIGGNYIFGFPDDTHETMNQTFEFAQKLNCEYSNFYTMMAYPGTSLYKTAVENNWELPTESSQYSQYSYDCLPLRTKHLTSKDVLLFRDNCFNQFVASDKYLSNTRNLFGQTVVDSIKELSKTKIRRKLYEI